LQPTYFGGATQLYNTYIQKMIDSKEAKIDEMSDLVLAKARNLSADDVSSLIDSVTSLIDWVKGKAFAGVPDDAVPAKKSPAASKPPTSSEPPVEEEKPEEPEEPEVVSATEAAESKKSQ